MSEDWMEWLTEEERDTVKFAANQSTAVFGSAAIFAWAHTVAASRALVAEKDKALGRIHVRANRRVKGEIKATSFSLADYDLSVTEPALALTEDEMRKRLEEVK